MKILSVKKWKAFNKLLYLLDLNPKIKEAIDIEILKEQAAGYSMQQIEESIKIMER